MTIERFAIHDRASWLALRSQDLTASDLGAAIGVDPWKSQLGVYAEKSGLVLPAQENAAMARGRWLEAAVVAALREECPGWDIRFPVGVYLRDPDCRLGATPDCIAEDPDEPGLINIQLKVVSRPVFERDWSFDNGSGDHGAPFGYRLQTLAEGYLLDARKSLLAALVIDTYTAELVLVDVPRHEAAEERVRQLAVEFWENIAAGRRPAPDYHRDAETVNAMFPPDSAVPAPLDLSSDNRIHTLLEQRAKLKAEIKADSEVLEALDAELVDKLKGATAAFTTAWKITRRLEERKGYTVAPSSRAMLRVTEQREIGRKAA